MFIEFLKAFKISLNLRLLGMVEVMPIQVVLLKKIIQLSSWLRKFLFEASKVLDQRSLL
jgi:hypothetical protein